MVYASQQTTGQNRRVGLDNNPSPQGSQFDFSALLDPALLQAARQIYRTYYEVHPDQVQRPLGVAIDRYTYRGKLIFTGKPVLLPQECFVPFNQIEAEIY